MTAFYVLWFISASPLALSAGVAFGHPLELPGKRRMPAETAVAVQQQLYVGYRCGGLVMELGALVTLATAAFHPVRGRRNWTPTLTPEMGLRRIHTKRRARCSVRKVGGARGTAGAIADQTFAWILARLSVSHRPEPT